MKVIHWYPGHMKKASNEMLETLKFVDVVIELVDARAPLKTSNPFFKDVIKNKPHVVIYMKSDLADLSKIKLKDNSILFSIKDKNGLSKLISLIDNANKKKREKEINRGIKPSLPRAMIVGIPNVGKSSLINALTNKNSAKVENKPGLTRNYRWFNIKNKFLLMDTPGILPTDYKDSNYVLAALGAIKDNILPVIELSDFVYDYIINNYKDLYIKRYKNIGKTSNESFEFIAELRGIKNDKSLNHERARELFLKEVRDGKLGCIYFD